MDQDTLVHGAAANGSVRCMAAVTTNLVAEAAGRHDLWPTAAAALGRTLSGTLLLGSSLKELDRLTVQIVSDGPIGGITAEANARGEVRGYVRNPEADAAYNEHGKLDVSAIVGNGMLYVTHESGYDVGLYREPYRGSVPLVSGEIADDFAFYLTTSEQIPSAVVLGVLLQPKAPYVAAAGGLILQLMPGADDNTIRMIEESIGEMPHATKMIQDGARPIDLLHAALGVNDLEILSEKPVAFACSCSCDRAVSLISSIDPEELQSMLTEDKGAVLTCHFCNETYRLDEEALKAILRKQQIVTSDIGGA